MSHNSAAARRVRENHIKNAGFLCAVVAALLHAFIIDLSTTYSAYGMPAFVLAVFGADVLYPTLSLYTANSWPPEDQAVGRPIVN